MELPDRYVCIHAASLDGHSGTGNPRTGITLSITSNVCTICASLSLGSTRPWAATMITATVTSAAKAASRNRPRSSAEPCFRRHRPRPSHLANAVQTPGVILLGRYLKWDYYMPYTGFYADARHCRILRHTGPVSELPLGLCVSAVDEVLHALRGAIKEPQNA